MAGFSFGNIIYLILIAVFAIYSSQKKKRKSQGASSNVNKKPSFFEELLSGEQLNIVPEPNVVYEEDIDPEGFEFKEEQVTVEKEDIINSETMIKDSPKEENFIEEIKDKGIDFDLRQAVIYSEILKRKYF